VGAARGQARTMQSVRRRIMHASSERAPGGLDRRLRALDGCCRLSRRLLCAQPGPAMPEEPPVSESLFAQIEAVRAAWDILRHPFYARWSCGELTRDELARYAGQYRHAVVALAEAAERAGSPHADEERAHVGLWDGFVGAVGGRSDADALPETAACAAAWAR